VREILAAHREDERRHLDDIRAALASPEHRGPALGTVLAGAALVTAGAAAAVWAIRSWRGSAAPREEAAPLPSWLVRRAPPGAPLAEAPARDGMSDFGDEAQAQAPGRPPNLALHEAEGDQARGERRLDQTTRDRTELP
jgi:hypothetical protein